MVDEVSMTFRYIKYKLGLISRIAVLKNKEGDYIIYDNINSLYKTEFLYDEFDEKLFINGDKPASIQKKKCTVGVNENSEKSDDFYLATLFSISLQLFPNDSKDEMEAYLIKEAYLFSKLKYKNNAYFISGENIKRLIKNRKENAKKNATTS